MTRIYAPHFFFFFFNDTATTEIYTLSLHDALPIFTVGPSLVGVDGDGQRCHLTNGVYHFLIVIAAHLNLQYVELDRKSTRLNSSHANISYAVFCLKKKKHFMSILMSFIITRYDETI